MTRRHIRQLALAAAFAASAANAAPRQTAMLGVNLAGGEAASSAMPGKLYFNYTYPSKAEIDLAYANGVRLFRLPIREDRVQDGFFGPLRPEVQAALYPAIDYIRSKPGTVVLIDWHSFGVRQGIAYGTPPWSVDAIVDLNMKFLAPYRSARSNVWLGLQNEPKGVGAQWWPVAQAVVSKLRAAGYSGPIVVGGEGYSAASSWRKSNGPGAAAFRDPANALIFEAHSYFDATGAGVKGECVPGSEKRIDPVIDDAADHHYRILFGELAFGDAPACDAVRKAVIARIKASPNVVGATFWAFGRFYPYPKYQYGLVSLGEVASPLLQKLAADWKN